MPTSAGAWPDLVVIGAMKCGTTALHWQLGLHPDISMAAGKELNFFLGPETAPAGDPAEWWRHGQWHRGPDWYRAHFEDGARLHGESSPGYTAPGSEVVAAPRMRVTVPGARLVYLVREPLDRAVSQWHHHRRDGTEPRPLEVALLDPASQYLARSRYAERLRPYLDLFDRDQILVVVQERLAADPRRELPRIFAHVGADPGFWDDRMLRRIHARESSGSVIDPRLRSSFRDAVGDDVAALRSLMDDELPEWCATSGPAPGR